MSTCAVDNSCTAMLKTHLALPLRLHVDILANLSVSCFFCFFFTRNEMRHQSAKVSNKTVGFSPNPRNGGHTPPHAASVRGHQHQLSPSDQGETWQTSEPRHTRGWSTTSVSTPVPSCAAALVVRTVRGLWPADPQTTSLPPTTCRQPPEREPPSEPWPLGPSTPR